MAIVEDECYCNEKIEVYIEELLMSEKILLQHRKVWEKKKCLQLVYKDWYRYIKEYINIGKDGTVLEIGGGIGNLKEYLLHCGIKSISCDIIYCKWLDCVFDAHLIPIKNNSISAIVMINVLHHLGNPIKFLHEAYRILKPEGRLIMLEPFSSLFSYMPYKLFHKEPFNYRIDYFNDERLLCSKDPFDANQAIAKILFYNKKDKFFSLFKGAFRLLAKQHIGFAAWPLTGGFEGKKIIPDFLVSFLLHCERFLRSISRILAFFCIIVLEKIKQE